MSGKQSLQEIMGKKGAASSKERKLTMDDLPSLLGDGMPKLQFSPLGRVRLFRALKQRFGNGFRNVPGVSDIVAEFDDSTRFEVSVRKMGKIKGKA